MDIAKRLRELSDIALRTDSVLAAELAILSSDAQGLVTEVERLDNAVHDQATVAVERIAGMITEVTNLKQVLSPFANAHGSERPYNEITLDDLRKAYDALNPNG